MAKISTAVIPSAHIARGNSDMIVSLLKKLYLNRHDIENVVNKSKLRTLAALIKDEKSGILFDIELDFDDDDEDEPNELPLDPNAIT